MGLPSVYLLIWEEWPLAYQGVMASVGIWNKATSCRKELRKGRSVGATGDGTWHQGRLKQMFCYRAGNETGVLEPMEQKRREGHQATSQLDFWKPWPLTTLLVLIFVRLYQNCHQKEKYVEISVIFSLFGSLFTISYHLSPPRCCHLFIKLRGIGNHNHSFLLP